MIDKCIISSDEKNINMMNIEKRLTNKQQTGQKGEDIACNYLINKGFEIVSRNWHFMHKEIDIVAKHNNTLIIVEVKTRAENSLILPEEAVNKRKQKLLVEAANLFIQKYSIDLEVQFDIVSVIYFKDNYKVEHIENAFYPRIK